jgi:phosphatidylglycerophosphatase A
MGYLLLDSICGIYTRAILGGLCVVVFAVGIWVGSLSEEVYARKDPPQFVLDEVVGMWLACLAFWWRTPVHSVIACFLAFRVFDVLKPPPVRKAEALSGGWGIMTDDAVAALWSVAVLWPLTRFVLSGTL